jgi:hypothetical protein
VSLADASSGVTLPPNCDTTTGVPLLPGSGSRSESATSSASGSAAAGGAPSSGGAQAGDPSTDVTASATADEAGEVALPTLPFGGSSPGAPALLATGAALLAAAATAVTLLIRKRRKNA